MVLAVWLPTWWSDRHLCLDQADATRGLEKDKCQLGTRYIEVFQSGKGEMLNYMHRRYGSFAQIAMSGGGGAVHRSWPAAPGC